jgi:hypothetical protein
MNRALAAIGVGVLLVGFASAAMLYVMAPAPSKVEITDGKVFNLSTGQSVRAEKARKVNRAGVDPARHPKDGGPSRLNEPEARPAKPPTD